MSWKIIESSKNCSHKDPSSYWYCATTHKRCTQENCPRLLQWPPMVLVGKDAREFERKIEEGLKHPVGLVPTPKLEEVREMIMRDSLKKEKADEKG